MTALCFVRVLGPADVGSLLGLLAVLADAFDNPEEMTFGASTFALTGIADALRESFRDQQLAVTCLQLGHLNTDDALEVSPEAAAGRGQGRQIPLHGVIRIVLALLQLSPASYGRELALPAIGDERF